MKTRFVVLLLAVLSPSLARAWDSQDLWNSPANGGVLPPGQMGALPPGGGGIFGTGGARDYNVTCADCHINEPSMGQPVDAKQQGQIDLSYQFTPALPTVSGKPGYQPGQIYSVKVNLLGEHLALPCTQLYVTGNINNFAASVEDASGRTAGTLSSDTGQSAAACPKALPTVMGGTSMLYGDCHAVFSMGGDKTDVDKTAWSFTWQAPAAGAGPLTFYWAVVDGNCMMDSLGDDVKVKNLKLAEALAAADPPARPWALALLAILPALGFAGRRRRG